MLPSLVVLNCSNGSVFFLLTLLTQIWIRLNWTLCVALLALPSRFQSGASFLYERFATLGVVLLIRLTHTPDLVRRQYLFWLVSGIALLLVTRLQSQGILACTLALALF